jgi:hypothetical protein
MKEALNDVRQWGDAGMVSPPSDFNRKKFQKKLDQIAGISVSSGLSIIRLIWGWESLITVNGEVRQRYAFHTITLPNGDNVDIATPRWFLEELIEPAQYKKEWERARYTIEGLELIDSIGPPPSNGLYLPAMPIARHESGNQCCVRLWAEERRRCVGTYRVPGEDTLDVIRKAVRERDKLKAQNPHEALPQDVMEECFALHYQKKKQWKEDMGYHVRQCINDFIHVYGENFASTDPSRHHWGKYAFLSGHNTSGTPGA